MVQGSKVAAARTSLAETLKQALESLDEAQRAVDYARLALMAAAREAAGAQPPTEGPDVPEPGAASLPPREELADPGEATLRGMAGDLAERWRQARERAAELSRATERLAVPLETAPPTGGGAPGEVQAYDLVAGPFQRFSTLQTFLSALRSQPGVRDVRVRRFQRGALLARVEYEGAVPLQHRLTELDDLPVEVRATDGNTIELTIAA